MERTITVEVTGELLRKSGKRAGVQGEANAAALEIHLDESWRGYGKRVIWRNAMGEDPVAVTLWNGQGGGDALTYRTLIPAEPLKEPGWCSFIIEGYRIGEDGADSVALTARDYLEVQEGDPYHKPAEPTPTAAQQLLGAMGETERAVQASAQEAKSWAAGGTGSREGEETDNARYYAEQAGKAAEETAAEVRTEFEALAADAGSSADAARAATAGAEAAQGKAETAQRAAEAAAVLARQRTEEAGASAAAAETAQAGAEEAEESAEAARRAAETARNEAAAFSGRAEAAQGAAEQARAGAEQAEENARRAQAEAEATAAEAAAEAAGAVEETLGRFAAAAASHASTAENSAAHAAQSAADAEASAAQAAEAADRAAEVFNDEFGLGLGTWEAITLPEGDWVFCHDDGVTVAVPGGKVFILKNEEAYWSEDNLTWHRTKMPAACIWKAAAVWQGKFVAVCSSSDSTGSTDRIAVSADRGRTWHWAEWIGGAPETAVGFGVLCPGKGGILALSEYVTGPAAWSEDGEHWECREQPFAALLAAHTVSGGAMILDACCAYGRYVVPLYGNFPTDLSLWSEDGRNWNTAELPETKDPKKWTCVAAGAGLFVMASAGGAVVAGDGESWTLVKENSDEMPEENGYWYGICRVNGRFIAVGIDGSNLGAVGNNATVCYSETGLEWKTGRLVGANAKEADQLRSVSACGGVALACNYGELFWTVDGEHWQQGGDAIVGRSGSNVTPLVAKALEPYQPGTVALARMRTSLEEHLQNEGNPHHILPTQVGGIPVVETYTPEGGTDGVDYAADVPGVTEPYIGMSITIIPHIGSSVTTPTLQINSGDRKNIARHLSNKTGGIPTALGGKTAIAQNKPLLLIYSGMTWIAGSLTKPNAEDLNGIVPVVSGGTGETSFSEGFYLCGNGEEPFVEKSPSQMTEDVLAVLQEAGDTGNPVVFPGIARPVKDTDAANKWYVDQRLGPLILDTDVPEGGTSGKDFEVSSSLITELYEGLMLIILPHVSSRVSATVTLKVNDFEAKPIIRAGAPTSYALSSKLYKNVPALLIYRRERGSWIHIGGTMPFFEGGDEILSVSHGGTGLSSIPSECFLAGNGTGTPSIVKWDAMAEYCELLSLHGGTMDGALTVIEPTEGAHAASKGYVDALLGDVAALLDSINGEVV